MTAGREQDARETLRAVALEFGLDTGSPAVAEIVRLRAALLPPPPATDGDAAAAYRSGLADGYGRGYDDCKAGNQRRPPSRDTETETRP